jgi:uncharacterized protein YndB with AHSA1/START domain
MVDILHRVGIVAPIDDVFAALTTIDGLAGWWTEDTSGDAGVDGVIKFRFKDAPPPGGFDMLVLETEPGQRVEWEVVGGADEWVGTRIRFDLKEEDGFTIVLFSHLDWREPVEFMHHCSTKWATFLMSLKKLVETGQGEAAPNDVKISNWH